MHILCQRLLENSGIITSTLEFIQHFEVVFHGASRRKVFTTVWGVELRIVDWKYTLMTFLETESIAARFEYGSGIVDRVLLRQPLSYSKYAVGVGGLVGAGVGLVHFVYGGISGKSFMYHSEKPV